MEELEEGRHHLCQELAEAGGFSPAVNRIGIVLLIHLISFRSVVWPSLAGRSCRGSGDWGSPGMWSVALPGRMMWFFCEWSRRTGCRCGRGGGGVCGWSGGASLPGGSLGFWAVYLTHSSAFVSETELWIIGALVALFLFALFFVGRETGILSVGCWAGVLSRSCCAGSGAVFWGCWPNYGVGLWAPTHAALAGPRFLPATVLVR